MSTDAAAIVPGVLSEVKREGGRLLVVGATGAQERACQRFHAPSVPHYHRVFLEPAPTECENGVASQAVAETGAIRVAPPVVCRSGADLGGADDVRLAQLSDVFVHTIDRVSTASLDPADLRVCVAPVDRLADRDGGEQLSLFLEAILERTRRANGMTHVHLHREYEDDLVRLLEPLFDAVIEVRSRPQPGQRWHVSDHDVTTDWVPI